MGISFSAFCTYRSPISWQPSKAHNGLGPRIWSSYSSSSSFSYFDSDAEMLIPILATRQQRIFSSRAIGWHNTLGSMVCEKGSCDSQRISVLKKRHLTHWSELASEQNFKDLDLKFHQSGWTWMNSEVTFIYIPITFGLKNLCYFYDFVSNWQTKKSVAHL